MAPLGPAVRAPCLHPGPTGVWCGLGSRPGCLCSEGVGVHAERPRLSALCCRRDGHGERGWTLSPRHERTLRPWGSVWVSDLGSEDGAQHHQQGGGIGATLHAASGGACRRQCPHSNNQTRLSRRGFEVPAPQALSSKGLVSPSPRSHR